MLTTYIITGTGEITFKFDINGNLVHFNYEGEILTNDQFKWLFDRFPIKESGIRHFESNKNLQVTKGEPNVSFDAFWNTYANKVGKRKMAENTWNRMSKADKIQVFINIPRYKNYLKYYPNQQMMYPTTYLNQEAYKNEWKV